MDGFSCLSNFYEGAKCTDVAGKGGGAYLINRQGERVSRIYKYGYPCAHLNYPYIFYMAKVGYVNMRRDSILKYGLISEKDRVIVPFRYKYFSFRTHYIKAVKYNGTADYYDYHGHRYKGNIICRRKPKDIIEPWERLPNKRYVMMNEAGVAVSDTFDALFQSFQETLSLSFLVANRRGKRIVYGVIGAYGRTIVPAEYDSIICYDSRECHPTFFAIKKKDRTRDVYSNDGKKLNEEPVSPSPCARVNNDIIIGKMGHLYCVIDTKNWIITKMDRLKDDYILLCNHEDIGEKLYVRKSDGTIAVLNFRGEEIPDFNPDEFLDSPLIPLKKTGK